MESITLGILGCSIAMCWLIRIRFSNAHKNENGYILVWFVFLCRVLFHFFVVETSIGLLCPITLMNVDTACLICVWSAVFIVFNVLCFVQWLIVVPLNGFFLCFVLVFIFVFFVVVQHYWQKNPPGRRSLLWLIDICNYINSWKI